MTEVFRPGRPASELDPVDRQLINTLQEGLPLVPRPYAVVAETLGLEEADLLARLNRLREGGAITRFGPFFDAAALGGAFCLCAMAVPQKRFDAALTKVNAHPEVAHNYERSHRLNMWFVLATETPGEIETVAAEIERETGIKVHLFPKLEEYFIGFRVAA